MKGVRFPHVSAVTRTRAPDGARRYTARIIGRVSPEEVALLELVLAALTASVREAQPGAREVTVSIFIRSAIRRSASELGLSVDESAAAG